KYLEEALLSTRLLTLDALSTLNVARRDKVLKSFMLSHQPTPETDSVFGGELQEIMEKRNRETKFFNDALYLRRRQESLEHKPTRPYYNSSTQDGPPESTTVTLNSGNTERGRLKEALHTCQHYFPHHWATTIIEKGYYPVWERTLPLRIHIPSQKLQRSLEIQQEVTRLIDQR
ncbi:20034_t:CDS:2, partial [Gigaspora rosea]